MYEPPAETVYSVYVQDGQGNALGLNPEARTYPDRHKAYEVYQTVKLEVIEGRMSDAIAMVSLVERQGSLRYTLFRWRRHRRGDGNESR